MDLGRHFKQLLHRLWLRLCREQRACLAVAKGATLLKGQCCIDGKPISVLYVGSDAIRNDLLAWFVSYPQMRGLSRAETLSLLAGLEIDRKRAASDHAQQKNQVGQGLDGVVIERALVTKALTAGLNPAKDAQLFQSLLDMNITCNGGFDTYLYDCIKKRRRNTINRGLKQPFTFRISTAPSDLELLYHNLFKPSTLKVHGTRSHLPTLDSFSRALERGELHICEEDGQALVANLVLINHRESKARLWRQGVDLHLLENPKLRSEATTFTDANTIKYCVENKIPRISFGKSVCLAEDGGFRNKAHWGCVPEIDKFYPFCYLYSLTPAMAEACTLTGFLDASAVAAYSAQPEEPLKKAG